MGKPLQDPARQRVAISNICLPIHSMQYMRQQATQTAHVNGASILPVTSLQSCFSHGDCLGSVLSSYNGCTTHFDSCTAPAHGNFSPVGSLSTAPRAFAHRMVLSGPSMTSWGMPCTCSHKQHAAQLFVR
jgi:hypothetical protein